MHRKIDIGKNAKVSVRWNVIPSDYSKEEERNIAFSFAEKYGIPLKNVSVEVNLISSRKDGNPELAKDVVENMSDPKFQHQLFKEYMLENNIEGYDFKEIVAIDSQINALIDYDKYDKSKKYRVKWMKWSNILSYGKDNFFDFTTLKGLVLLKGEPANKSGKSTFAYDLLHILLFGKTRAEKAETIGQLFNNYLPDETEASIEGCLEIDGQDYIIKRVFTRPAKTKKAVRTASQKVMYYRLLNGDEYEELKEENLEGETGTVTNKVIRQAIGNEEDFNLIISANAKDLDDLITLKETARGKLLTRWIGLMPIEDKDVKAREMWNKSISVGRYCDIYNRDTLKAQNNTYNEEIKENVNFLSGLNLEMANLTETLDSDKKKKDELLSSKKPIDERLMKIDYETVNRRLDTIKDVGGCKKAERNNIRETIAGLGNISEPDEAKYKSLQSEKEKAITAIATANSEIRRLENLNKDLKSKEYCPTCGRKFDNVDNTKIIEENVKTINEYKSTLNKLETEKSNLTKLIGDIDDARKSFQEKNKLEIKLSAMNVELSELASEFNELTRTKNDLDNMKAAIIENNKIDTSINILSETIKVNERLMNEKRNNISTLESANKELDTQIKKNTEIIEKINTEVKTEKNWKLYLKMIGKDGISKLVLRNTLPIINSELKRLLGDVCDFDVEVTINDKNDVEFWLIRDGVRSKLSSASGLETTQAALALRAVLGNMSVLSRPSFILLDEILGSVAKENYDDMKKLYDKIVGNYDFVLHICHIDLDWHNGGIITVTKNNNISSIKCAI